VTNEPGRLPGSDNDKLSADGIRCLLAELIEHDATPATKRLFGRLGTMPTQARMLRNLDMMLSALYRVPRVVNLITDALTTAEKLALLEVDSGYYTERAKSAASDLLCIRERYTLWRAISGFNRRAYEREQAGEGFVPFEEEAEQ